MSTPTQDPVIDGEAVTPEPNRCIGLTGPSSGERVDRAAAGTAADVDVAAGVTHAPLAAFLPLPEILTENVCRRTCGWC